MTSALLFVALLILLDLSYRRWTRRYLARRLQRAQHASPIIDLTGTEPTASGLTETRADSDAPPHPSALTVYRRREAPRPRRRSG